MAQEDFLLAAAFINHVPESGPRKFDDATKLQFYKYYKQATQGDCNTAKPSMFSMQASAKWTAWDSIKGMSSDEAAKQYVLQLESVEPNWKELAAKYNLTPSGN